MRERLHLLFLSLAGCFAPRDLKAPEYLWRPEVPSAAAAEIPANQFFRAADSGAAITGIDGTTWEGGRLFALQPLGRFPKRTM